MRFLIDAQLPPALARFLSEQGHDAEHIYDIGDKSTPDTEIWRIANETGAVIVTKDSDFVVFALSAPDGPQVILIRFGNTRRLVLLKRFAQAFPEILAALESGERLIEVR